MQEAQLGKQGEGWIQAPCAPHPGLLAVLGPTRHSVPVVVHCSQDKRALFQGFSLFSTLRHGKMAFIFLNEMMVIVNGSCLFSLSH
jgi:hypothetical protein